MKKEIKNYPASVHQLLLNEARKREKPFNEILQYYVIERFLYRLGKTQHKDNVILKGAMMFIVWNMPYARATRDIDLLARTDNSMGNVVQMIKDVCKIEYPNDGMTYLQETIRSEQIIEDGSYQGVRVKLIAMLGSVRTTVQIDFGFGDIVFPKPENIDFPSLINLPTAELKGYPKETVIAEKFHVMISRGLLNSRMKDFYDLWLLINTFDFDMNVIRESIKKTFANRKTEIDLDLVVFSEDFDNDTDKNIQWKAFIGKSTGLPAPENFKDIAKMIKVFIFPVINSIGKNSADKYIWQSPGPWEKLAS